jgi:hypothetical protein
MIFFCRSHLHVCVLKREKQPKITHIITYKKKGNQDNPPKQRPEKYITSLRISFFRDGLVFDVDVEHKTSRVTHDGCARNDAKEKNTCLFMCAE